MLILGLREARRPGAERIVIVMPDGREISISLMESKRHDEYWDFRVGVVAPDDVMVERRTIPLRERLAARNGRQP